MEYRRNVTGTAPNRALQRTLDLPPSELGGGLALPPEAMAYRSRSWPRRSRRVRHVPAMERTRRSSAGRRRRFAGRARATTDRPAAFGVARRRWIWSFHTPLHLVPRHDALETLLSADPGWPNNPLTLTKWTVTAMTVSVKFQPRTTPCQSEGRSIRDAGGTGVSVKRNLLTNYVVRFRPSWPFFLFPFVAHYVGFPSLASLSLVTSLTAFFTLDFGIGRCDDSLRRSSALSG